MSVSHSIAVYSNYWRQECHKFYFKNPGSVISKLNFNSVFREAWLSAKTPANVISGFRNTGVYPFNRHAIGCVSASSQGSNDLPTQGIIIIIIIILWTIICTYIHMYRQISRPVAFDFVHVQRCSRIYQV